MRQYQICQHTHTHSWDEGEGRGIKSEIYSHYLVSDGKTKKKKEKRKKCHFSRESLFCSLFLPFSSRIPLFSFFPVSLLWASSLCLSYTLACSVCVCVQKDQQNISALSGGRGKNHRASTRHWFTHKYVRNFCFSKTHPSLIGWSDLLGSDCCWGFVDWTDRSRALHCVIKKRKRKKKEDTDSLPNELSG